MPDLPGARDRPVRAPPGRGSGGGRHRHSRAPGPRRHDRPLGGVRGSRGPAPWRRHRRGRRAARRSWTTTPTWRSSRSWRSAPRSGRPRGDVHRRHRASAAPSRWSGRVVRGRATPASWATSSLDPGGPPCNCGRRGCSEVLASGTALNRLIARGRAAAGHDRGGAAGRADEDAVAAGVLRRWAGAWRTPSTRSWPCSTPTWSSSVAGLGAAAVAALRGLLPSTSPWFGARWCRPGWAMTRASSAPGCERSSRMTRAVLVNGVPATGKTTIARAHRCATGRPGPELDASRRSCSRSWATGCRPRVGSGAGAGQHRLACGRCSAGFPTRLPSWSSRPGSACRRTTPSCGSGAAGVDRWVEVWCHADPAVLVARYEARTRHPGHPAPEDFVDELRHLAALRTPDSAGPVLEVDTSDCGAYRPRRDRTLGEERSCRTSRQDTNRRPVRGHVRLVHSASC